MLLGRSLFRLSPVVGARRFSTTNKGLLPLLEHVDCSLPTAQLFLRQFEQVMGDNPCFAIIKVGGEVVEPGPSLDQLVKTCSTLNLLGLRPVVIHGGGPQMNDELKKRGVEPEYIGGHRVTDKATLDVAQSVFTGLNERVVATFNQGSDGVVAEGLTNGIFHAEMANPELGFVGTVEKVNIDPVVALLKKGVIPVLTSLGRNDHGQVLNINADVAAREMALSLKPCRVVFTSAKGGWIDEDTQKLASVVDMANEYENIASRDYTGRQGTLLKIVEIKMLLDGLPDTSSVAITAAESVLQELFTHKGGGTLFVKGEQLNALDSVGSADVNALLTFLSSSKYSGLDFDYFKNLQATLKKLYIYGDTGNAYSAAAIVTEMDGKPILEVFHVADDATGLGRETLLWKRVMKDFPSIAWRLNPLSDKLKSMTSEDASGVVATAGGEKWGWISTEDSNSWTYDKVTSAVGDIEYLKPTQTDAAKLSDWSSKAQTYEAKQSDNTIKVGLLGARGFVGREFAKLLTQHPGLELTCASSRALVGQRVIESFGLGEEAADHGIAQDLKFAAIEPEEFAEITQSKQVDMWVLALPNGLAPRFLDSLSSKDPNSDCLMIDLGADFRFTDDWTYGLPERPGAREKLKGTKRISNPGCYATGAQVGLMPLLNHKEGLAPLNVAPGTVPTVFGVSGYSGAGTSPSPKNDPICLKDNLMPYSLTNHIHEREASRHLGATIGFMPHVAPFFQGISLTISCHLDRNESGQFPTAEEVAQYYSKYYAGEKLVTVYEDPARIPKVRDVMFTSGVILGGFNVDEKTGRMVVVSLIDNLLKGAATQALQNVNIASGFSEYEGIQTN